MIAHVVVYAIAAAVLTLGVFPFFHFLVFGLFERRREVLSYFGDKSIKLYFRRFYSAEADKLLRHPRDSLLAMYNDRFGVRTFLLPGAVYIGSLILLIWVMMSSLADTALSAPALKLEARGTYALAGAYFWVTWDLIARYRQRDVVRSSLYGYAFRFVISIPLAGALSTLFTDAGAAPIAFALGAFPTTSLIRIIRRQSSKRLGLGDDVDEPKSQLEQLNCINTTLAEKFSDIGVTTMLQLAYEDPIQLAMRTNLSVNYITDTISQALATIYGLDLKITTPFSVRGGIEAAETFEALKSRNSDDSARAKVVVEELAKIMKKPTEVVEKVLHDIRGDPYTDFLREVWA